MTDIDNTPIHVIGVGKLGLPIAQLFKRAGHRVTVSDTAPQAEKHARDHGLPVVPAEDGIAAASVILSSLPDDRALLAVGRQVAGLAGVGAVYVDTSTVSQAASAQVARDCEAAGLPYLRCTVSGNGKMARAAQLTVLVSGPREVYVGLRPLLQTLGPAQFYLGDGEQARLMKLVVNLMIVQTSAMLAEALTLGRKGGLDWGDMWDVLSDSAVASPILRAKAPHLRERDFSPTFTVPQMIKDVDLMLAEGERCQAPLDQTRMTRQLLQRAIALGMADDDYASVIRVLESDAGL